MRGLSAFDPRQQRFAVVTADHRVKIWEIATAMLKFTLEEKNHLSAKYCSVAWGAYTPTKSEERGLGAIAVGCYSGAIKVWNVTTGELSRTLGGNGFGHSGAVNDLAFSTDGATLYSCSSDLHVCVWDLRTGTMLKKFQADRQQPLQRIALSLDSSKLLSATTTIKLWDLSSYKKLQKYSGHTNHVSSLKFSRDGKFAVSSTNGDRFINCWKTEAGADPATFKVFTCESPPVSLDFKNVNDTYYLLALSANDVISLWSFVEEKETTQKKKSVKESVIEPQGKLVFNENNQNEKILMVAFANDDKSIMVVRGDPLQPRAEKVAFLENGAIKPQLELKEKNKKKAEKSNLLVSDSVAKKTSKTNNGYTVLDATHANPLRPVKSELLETKKRKVDEQTEAAQNGQTKNNQHEEKTKKKRTGENESENMEEEGGEKPKLKESAKREEVGESLEDQLRSLSFPVLKTKKKGREVPRADSLQTVLVQAIHNSDRLLLDNVLSVLELSVIKKTIERLPTKFVIPLLFNLIERFESKPNRTSLIMWIRVVLLQHTSYLLSVPDLMNAFSTLYQTVDARLSVFKDLLKLSGRLDLVLTQISNKEDSGSRGSSKPRLSIQEGEEPQRGKSRRREGKSKKHQGEEEGEEEEGEEEEGEDDEEGDEGEEGEEDEQGGEGEADDINSENDEESEGEVGEEGEEGDWEDEDIEEGEDEEGEEGEDEDEDEDGDEGEEGEDEEGGGEE
eukprot:TRINITY_DN481_c0_g1_i5.p1 TRINITY_DN481_c0_g1~~TRINITY_DN481_c0_g1_i5.p1  ORF type:complete len:733 (-),score=254.10 TRINITY_DN481_c0_g1_i5:317-2515(-)